MLYVCVSHIIDIEWEVNGNGDKITRICYAVKREDKHTYQPIVDLLPIVDDKFLPSFPNLISLN